MDVCFTHAFSTAGRVLEAAVTGAHARDKARRARLGTDILAKDALIKRAHSSMHGGARREILIRPLVGTRLENGRQWNNRPLTGGNLYNAICVTR